MLIILSPSKDLHFSNTQPISHYSQPQLLDKASQLVEIARKLSPAQLSSLMKISDRLALLNAQRFNDWQLPFTPDNARQAILAFSGDVYTGLQADSFSAEDFDYAQKHLRILSGLYGILRPLDLIQPYRLEMGSKLANPAGKDLYHFWDNILTEALNNDLAQQQDDILINLASDEYFKSILQKKLKYQLIKPVFLDEKNGKFKVISIYAKKARGLMSRFIIQQRLTKPEQLKSFNLAGYFFDDESSSDNQLIFKRYQAS